MKDSDSFIKEMEEMGITLVDKEDFKEVQVIMRELRDEFGLEDIPGIKGVDSSMRQFANAVAKYRKDNNETAFITLDPKLLEIKEVLHERYKVRIFSVTEVKEYFQEELNKLSPGQ
jgi:RNAse (barnase) inhibitor barstar